MPSGSALCFHGCLRAKERDRETYLSLESERERLICYRAAHCAVMVPRAQERQRDLSLSRKRERERLISCRAAHCAFMVPALRFSVGPRRQQPLRPREIRRESPQGPSPSHESPVAGHGCTVAAIRVVIVSGRRPAPARARVTVRRADSAEPAPGPWQCCVRQEA